MGKIKEFHITTSLGEDEVYYAGSMVEGKVIIHLKNPKVINGPIRITLSGQARVQWKKEPRERGFGYSALRSSMRHSAAQTIFSDMTLQLWGAESVTLGTGRHEFPYRFQLPARIPSSHNDILGYIQYALTAVMPTKKQDFTKQKILQVREFVRIDTSDLISPLYNSSEKTLNCFCCGSSPITLSVTLDRGGYTCGEAIIIRESHGYRRLTKVHATLTRKTTYYVRRTSDSRFSYKHIAATSVFNDTSDMSGIRIGYLHIPNAVPSINCSTLKVSYFLIVTLAFKFPRVKNLIVSIPITIGNTRGSTTRDSGLFQAPPPPYSEYAFYPSAVDINQSTHIDSFQC